MKVKDLIAELLKQDQNKEVFIQQGEDFDYMKAYSVKEKELYDADYLTEDGETITAVVIEFT